MSAAEVVEAQINAFNGREFDAFLATYAEDVCVYEMPHAKPVLIGKTAFASAYRPGFAKLDERAEILSRMVVGNKVVDHERVVGWKPEPVEVVAVYEVHEGLIRAMWFFKPDNVSKAPAEF